MNFLSDSTSEEILSLYLGVKAPQNSQDPESTPMTFSSGSVPEAVDWRTQGAVTPIKNQKSCGGCYSFAVAAALETLNVLRGNPLTEFSMQYLIDCSTTVGNNGCKGGYVDRAINYTRDNGIPLNAVYPFINKQGNCTYSPSQSVFQPSGYTKVPKNKPDLLKNAVAQTAVVALIYASDPTFFQYSSGVITICEGTVNHAVTIVGYNATVPGEGDLPPYWIVKNSWGTSWGEQGYVKIAMGTQNNGTGLCGINQWAYTPY